ncbi:hypothetical protein [Rahnella perminowiae]|uniref:hypothetical protein n=1 Tax=Rahnella perminowiae TaxID=2816244 RepID=UPI00215C05A6|nr:hypothetical protein [Rahnella perminowiae]MCR9003256.1 hypothetical protein [Rahnella perminowiae]
METNSSFIRKLMVPLTQHGIIVSTLGIPVRSRLAARRRNHTSRHLYAVIEDKRLWAAADVPPLSRCRSANACVFQNIVSEAGIISGIGPSYGR